MEFLFSFTNVKLDILIHPEKCALITSENFSEYLKIQAKTDPQLEECRKDNKFKDLFS